MKSLYIALNTLFLALSIVTSAVGAAPQAHASPPQPRIAKPKATNARFRYNVARKEATRLLKLVDNDVSSSIPFLAMKKFPNGQHTQLSMDKPFLAAMIGEQAHFVTGGKGDQGNVAPAFAGIAKLEAEISAQVTFNPIRMIQRHFLLKRIKAERQQLVAKFRAAVNTFPNLAEFLSWVPIGDDLFRAGDLNAGRPSTYESRLPRVIDWAMGEVKTTLLSDAPL